MELQRYVSDREREEGLHCVDIADGAMFCPVYLLFFGKDGRSNEFIAVDEEGCHLQAILTEYYSQEEIEAMDTSRFLHMEWKDLCGPYLPEDVSLQESILQLRRDTATG